MWGKHSSSIHHILEPSVTVTTHKAVHNTHYVNPHTMLDPCSALFSILWQYSWYWQNQRIDGAVATVRSTKKMWVFWLNIKLLQKQMPWLTTIYQWLSIHCKNLDFYLATETVWQSPKWLLNITLGHHWTSRGLVANVSKYFLLSLYTAKKVSNSRIRGLNDEPGLQATAGRQAGCGIFRVICNTVELTELTR